MSNMSYCRFQNTDSDLNDCADDLERRITGEGCDEDGDPIALLSEREERAAASLIGRCAAIIEMVKEDRGLEEEDELTVDEIEKFVASIQRDARKASEIRNTIEEDGLARVGDYIVLDGTPRRVISIDAVGDEDDGYTLSFRLDDGRVIGPCDFTSDDVKLESEVRPT